MARRGVKAFTTWDYKHGGVIIKVPVELVDTAKTAGRTGYNDDKTFFSVQMSEPEIREQGTDINELRQRVFAQLKQTLEIEWRNMLVVELQGSRGRLYDKKKKPNTPDTETCAEASLTITWDRWQVAKVKGKKYARSFNNYYKPISFGKEKKDQPRECWNTAIDRWPVEEKEENEDFFRSGHNRMAARDNARAMIPDTPENRQSLELIADNLETLCQQLKKLMASDQIEKTLLQVASKGLLSISR